MRLGRALLGLLLYRLAARLYVAATALLEGSGWPPPMPWRSALLAGVVAARIVGAGGAL